MLTHALLPNSPALNAGQSGAVLTDARGVGRDAVPDVGAFEVQHPLSPVGVNTIPSVVYGPHPNGSTTEAYVKGLYKATLLRDAEPTGLAHWIGQLDGNLQTRAQVSRGFVNSNENRTNQVNFFYRYFLGRTPDPGICSVRRPNSPMDVCRV